MLIQIYNNPEMEKTLQYDVKYIKHVKFSLPFQIEEISGKPDITHKIEYFIGRVMNVHKGLLKKGQIATFKRRVQVAKGIASSEVSSNRRNKHLEDEFYTLKDSFIKVNGKEIY